MERWNPFILKGVLTPETQSWQLLSTAAFNNMVIVLLIRILLHIWHPCYVLIERRIIFWHIFYEIMTAINLITIIFLHISVWAWFVGEWTVCLAGIVSHVGYALSRRDSAWPEQRGWKWPAVHASQTHLRSSVLAQHPFVLGSDITISRAIHWRIIPPLYTYMFPFYEKIIRRQKLCTCILW